MIASQNKDKKMLKLNLVPAENAVSEELNQACLTQLELKAKIEFLTSELKTKEDIIKAHLCKTETGKVITPQWSATLDIQDGRESFSLKNAKAVLGEEVLKPFITIGKPFSVLRVK